MDIGKIFCIDDHNIKKITNNPSSRTIPTKCITIFSGSDYSNHCISKIYWTKVESRI